MSEPTEATQTPDKTPPSGMPEPPFTLWTPLAKKLWALRQQIIASGVPLPDWDGIEREVQERRGERGVALETHLYRWRCTHCGDTGLAGADGTCVRGHQ